MKHDWAAEHCVPAKLAHKLITIQFPDLAPITVASLGHGLDNTAYLVNRRFVFRFPRRRKALALLHRECQTLPRIANSLPVAVPLPLFAGQPSDSYPWPFVGFTYLPSRLACSSALTLGQRHRLARPLGLFLSSLHSIDTATIPAIVPRHAPRHELITPEQLDQAVAKVCAVRHLLGNRTLPRLISVIESSSGLPLQPGTLALVHGDLYGRHLLLDRCSCLRGVIDWGDMHIGTPATDLAVAHLLLPQSGHGPFLDAYGQVSSEEWRFARFRALKSALYKLAFAGGIGDEPLKRESLRALRFLAASSARHSNMRI